MISPGSCFVSTSQEISCEEHLRNDLFCRDVLDCKFYYPAGTG